MWRLRVFVGSDAATGNPGQLSRTFKGTKRQADTALAGFLAEVMSGGAPMADDMTVAAYLHRWLDHITPTRSPTTVRGYRFKIEDAADFLGGLLAVGPVGRMCRSTHKAAAFNEG